MSKQEGKYPGSRARKYNEFMTQTHRFREAIDGSAAALDQHVEEQIERARGN